LQGNLLEVNSTWWSEGGWAAKILSLK
jgi:hypothetical protein